METKERMERNSGRRVDGEEGKALRMHRWKGRKGYHGKEGKGGMEVNVDGIQSQDGTRKDA